MSILNYLISSSQEILKYQKLNRPFENVYHLKLSAFTNVVLSTWKRLFDLWEVIVFERTRRQSWLQLSTKK